MREWFYVIEGESRGPLAEDELMARFKDNGLPPETLVWSDGMAEWLPASRCTELPRVKAVPKEKQPAKTTGWQLWAEGEQVRPWIRYWARSIDLSIFSFFVAPLFSVLMRRVGSTQPYLVVVGIVLAYVFAEPWVISRFGTTPGKALLHTRIRTVDGGIPDYRRALRRSVEVWIRGMGMGLPIVIVVAHAFSYLELTRRGATTWDRSGGFVVQHAPLGRTRALVAIAYLVGICVMAASALGG